MAVSRPNRNGDIPLVPAGSDTRLRNERHEPSGQRRDVAVPVAPREHPSGDLYRTLFALKRENTALWNARWGAPMVNIPNSADTRVLSFVRRNERDNVFAVLNFSADAHTVTSTARCATDDTRTTSVPRR